MAFSLILENYIPFYKNVFHTPTNPLKICSKIHVQIKISSYSTVNFFAHYNTMYGIGLYEKTALCCLFLHYIIGQCNVCASLKTFFSRHLKISKHQIDSIYFLPKLEVT